MDNILIDAAVVLVIINVVKALKIILESKWLVWLLKLIGHAEVVPWIAYALTAVVGILAGLVAYGQDGLTLNEIIRIILEILGANLQFKFIKFPGKES